MITRAFFVHLVLFLKAYIQNQRQWWNSSFCLRCCHSIIAKTKYDSKRLTNWVNFNFYGDLVKIKHSSLNIAYLMIETNELLSTNSCRIYLSQSVKAEMNRTGHNWVPFVSSSITNVSNLLKSYLPFSGPCYGCYFPQTHPVSISQ